MVTYGTGWISLPVYMWMTDLGRKRPILPPKNNKPPGFHTGGHR